MACKRLDICVARMTTHCVQMAVLSRVRDSNTESSKGYYHVLGSFSNNNDGGYENVTWKVKSRCFKLYCASVRQIMCKAGSFFRELHSKDGWEKEKESRPLEFKSTTKLEIRHFYVVVVQWQQRNVQTCVMQVQSCCFANQTVKLFWSFRRCRRRWCLSPLLESFKNYHFQNEAKCKTFLVEMRFIWSGVHNPFRFAD